MRIGFPKIVARAGQRLWLGLFFVFSLALAPMSVGVETVVPSEPVKPSLIESPTQDITANIEKVELEPSESSTNIAIVKEEPVKVEPAAIALDAHLETLYSTGNSIYQGFLIPKARLSASGTVAPWIRYRLSVGQTREYSTVLLPMLLPVEAYIDISNRSLDTMQAVDRWTWRVGMFTPQLNPWWTPDLVDLEAPSYQRTHQQLFLSRDIGLQLMYQSVFKRFEATVGVVNGNGIVSLNTNSSKAFTGYTKIKTSFLGAETNVGASGYYLRQSKNGNTNYVSNWVVNVFGSMAFQNVEFFVEWFVGRFANSFQYVATEGFAGGLTVNGGRWVKWFSRYEYLAAPPQSQAAALRSFETGPILLLNPNLKISLIYSHVREMQTNNIFDVRLRLAI